MVDLTAITPAKELDVVNPFEQRVFFVRDISVGLDRYALAIAGFVCGCGDDHDYEFLVGML